MHVTPHEPRAQLVNRSQVRRLTLRRPADAVAPEVAPWAMVASIALLAVTLAAYGVLAIGYAVRTPLWQNPDEPAHYTYVAHVATTGGLPELRPGDWDAALLERLKNGALEPGDSVASIRYEAWQPPLFYLLAAPVLRGFATDFRAEYQDPAVAVLRLRALNVLLGALTLGVAFLIASEVWPRPLAAAVPLVMVGVPMFTSVSAAISADPLANLVAAVVLLVLVRRLRERRISSRPPPGAPRWAVGTGALLGLGLLTKLGVGVLVPIALGVVVARSRQRVRDIALVVATCGLVVLPWLVHQVSTYGWLDPLAFNRHAAVVIGQQRFEGLSAEWLGRFLTVSFHSFWAQFGWMGIVAPDRLYWIWGALMLAGVVGLLRRRDWLGQPAWRLLLATVCMAGLAYVGYNLSFEQFQGRYLFTSLVPMAMLLAAGWAAWVPRRWSAWGVALVGALLVGLNAYALVRVLVSGFAPTG